MKIKLTFSDRVNLLVIFPEQGKYENLVIARDIKKKIDVSQKEISFHELRTIENGGKFMQTMNNKNKVYEIDFTPAEIMLVSTILKGLSDMDKLPVSCLGIFEGFEKSKGK